MTALDRLRAASGGHRESLAAFAVDAMNNVITDPLRSEDHLAEAATFARLAAMHGDAKDMQCLAGILIVQAQLLNDRASLALDGPDEGDVCGYFIQASTGVMAEAIHWLNAAADAGSEDATEYLLMLADSGYNPEAFTVAKQIDAKETMH